MKFIAILCVALCAVVAFGQNLDVAGPNVPKFEIRYTQAAVTGTNWTVTTAYQAKSKHWDQVATHSEGTIQAVLGHANWNLNIDTFAGVDSTDGSAVGGVAGDVRFPFAKNASGLLGVGAFLESNKPVSAGILVGASIQF